MSSPRRPSRVSERPERSSDSTDRDDGRHGLEPALFLRRAVRGAVRAGLHRLERARPVCGLRRGQRARGEQLVQFLLRLEMTLKLVPFRSDLRELRLEPLDETRLVLSMSRRHDIHPIPVRYRAVFLSRITGTVG